MACTLLLGQARGFFEAEMAWLTGKRQRRNRAERVGGRGWRSLGGSIRDGKEEFDGTKVGSYDP